MNAGLAWILGGTIVCGTELVLPGAFLLWIGVAAILTGLLTLQFGLGLMAEIPTFLIMFGLLLSVILVRRRRTRSDGANAPDRDIVGRTCRALAFDGAEGRVSFRDGTWAAILTDGATPVSGASLRVVGLRGTRLLVTAMPEDHHGAV